MDNSNMTTEEKTINYIANYVRGLCGSDEKIAVPLSTIQVVLDEWKRLGRRPTGDELIEKVWSQRDCHCLDDIPKPLCMAIFKLLMTFKPSDRWNCSAVILVYNYYMMEKQWPTWSDMQRMYINMTRMDTNPDQYSQEERVRTGISIETHKTTTDAKDHTCSLCFSGLSDKVFKLPCGHMFHQNGDECIGTSIEKWFVSNTTCPLCRADLRFVKNENKQMGK